MSELRNILTDSVNGLFGDRVTRELLTRFDETGDDGGIWAEVEAQGLTRPLVSEENGGVGGEWRDVFAFSIMFVVLLVRPAGLFGRPELVRV